MSINAITVSGRFCADPEKVEGDARTYAKGRMAINQGKEKPAIFVDLVCWSRWSIEDLLRGHKGDKLTVSGRLTLREWEGRDGDKRSQLGISCESVEVHATAPKPAGPPDADEDDIPW